MWNLYIDVIFLMNSKCCFDFNTFKSFFGEIGLKHFRVNRVLLARYAKTCNESCAINTWLTFA